MSYNHETEILEKLGILHSKLESPNKMKGGSYTRTAERRSQSALSVATITASSLSDSSDDDEIVFDRLALLNARRRRRRQRTRSSALRYSSRRNTPDAAKWRLIGLASAFLCLGLATAIFGLTRDDLLSKIGVDVRIHSYFAIGLLIGIFAATWLFTRINPHLCICMLLAVSIPLTSLLIYQDSLTHIHAFLLIQGACFGAIESGAHLMIKALWKRDCRILFALYAMFATGALLSCALTGLTASNTSTIATNHGLQLHTVNGDNHALMKRAVSVNYNQTATSMKPNIAMSSKNVDLQLVTRPIAAIGIDVEADSKTRQNEQSRKKIADASNSVTTPKTTIACFEGVNCSTTTTTIGGAISEDQIASTRSSVVITTIRPTTRLITTPSRTSALVVAQSQSQSPMTTTSRSVLKQLGDAPHLLYAMVTVIMLLALVQQLLGVFVSCLVGGGCSMIADARIAAQQLEATSTSGETRVRCAAFICLLLQAIGESTALVALPLYAAATVGDGMPSIAAACALHWTVASVVRGMIAIRPTLATRAATIKWIYGLVAVGFLLIQFTSSNVAPFGHLAVWALLTTMPLLTFAWLEHRDDTLHLSRLHLVAVACARGVTPLLVAEYASRAVAFETLIAISSIAGVGAFALLYRLAIREARKRHFAQLSTEVNARHKPPQPPPKRTRARKGAYAALLSHEPSNLSDADVEMEPVALSDASEASI